MTTYTVILVFMCVYCPVITHGVTEGGTIDKGYHGGKVRIGGNYAHLVKV